MNIEQQWRTGNKQLAVNLCQDVLRKDPQNALAHNLYAEFLRDTGNTAEALKHYQAACSLPNTNFKCFLDFSKLLEQNNRLDNAQEVLSVGTQKWPQNALAWRELGLIQSKNDNHAGALISLERCIALAPNDWIAWNHLGNCRSQNNHADKAIEYFDKSLLLATEARNPKASEQDIEHINLNKAKAMTGAGYVSDARIALENALKNNPNSDRAWFDLANLVKCTRDQITQMETCLEQAERERNEDAARNLHFALGRSWDYERAPEKAIRHFDLGNSITRKNLDYNSAEVCKKIKHTPDFFPAELFGNIEERRGKSKLRIKPVFIVGMPRSGSTLTEQILATHPSVIGAGELTAFPNIRKSVLGSDFASRVEHKDLVQDPQILSQLRTGYLDQIEKVANDIAPDLVAKNKPLVIVDKMLGNFDMIGMILQSIPEALIIHCRRNPVDTCLSCYATLFRSPVSYSYDQRELAEFYNAYDFQMKHWHSVLPDTVLLESHYEAMINDTENCARELLDFVGLPWVDSVLDFHKAKRTINTASTAQVRKPIYKSSVERWRPYEPYIQPMLETLGER